MSHCNSFRTVLPLTALASFQSRAAMPRLEKLRDGQWCAVRRWGQAKKWSLDSASDVGGRKNTLKGYNGNASVVLLERGEDVKDLIVSPVILMQRFWQEGRGGGGEGRRGWDEDVCEADKV